MTIEHIFITQIISIIAFIIALFVLYRVLVSQKDASIELLKEKNTYLKDQLENAKENTPDKLAKKLSDRIHILMEELDRLSKDQVKHHDEIQQKEKDLQDVQNNLDRLRKQLDEAQEIASEFLCPDCGALMNEHTYIDNDRYCQELISFECGHTLMDGIDTKPCKYKKS